MTRKPQGALLEFKVSSPFFIIGLQASGDAYNSLHCSVVPDAKQSAKKEKRKRKVWKELSDSPRSFSPTREPCAVWQRSVKRKILKSRKHAFKVCWCVDLHCGEQTYWCHCRLWRWEGGCLEEGSTRAPASPRLPHLHPVPTKTDMTTRQTDRQTGYNTEEAFWKILKDQRSKALVSWWEVFCKHMNVSKYQLHGIHLLSLLNNKLQSEWKAENRWL